jgi:ATP-dependent Clp protease ATP-binding subunit ClpC
MTRTAFEALRTARPELAERFDEVPVHAQNAEEALAALTVLRDQLETRYGVALTEPAVHAAVALADRYRPGAPPLVTALDLIDAAAARLHAAGDRTPEQAGGGPGGTPVLNEDLLTAIASEQGGRAA